MLMSGTAIGPEHQTMRAKFRKFVWAELNNSLWNVLWVESKIWTRGSGKRASSQTKAKTKAEEKHIKIRPFFQPNATPPLWSAHILFRFAPRAEFWETSGWGLSMFYSSCFKVLKTQIYHVCNANLFVYLWRCMCAAQSTITAHRGSTRPRSLWKCMMGS